VPSKSIPTRTFVLALFVLLAILAVRRGLRAPIALTPVQPEPPASLDADAGADEAASVADAGGPRCLSEAMANLEPQARWLTTFDGTPAADKQDPPRLGALADLPELPRSQLAFVRSNQIFVVDLPGGAERALTHGGRDSNPRWSPRGTHLAFVREEQHESFVYLIRSDGTQLRRLSAIPLFLGVTFSADGRYLAFPAADHDVVVHDLDTDAEQRLATPDRVGAGPVFEASGSRLAMTVSGDDHRVFVADAATGRVEPHELPTRHHVYSIAFAPGALLLAMSLSVDPNDSTAVWRLSLDRRQKLAAEHMPAPMVGAGVELVAAPGGSPIALVNNALERTYTAQPDGTTELVFGDWFRREVFFYDRRHPEKDSRADDLPQPRFSTASPAWAPDGRHLAFVVELWSNPSDSTAEARGIVAIDTKATAPAPAYVACGEDPSWGPPAPAAPAIERLPVSRPALF
jgi:Tol biopolymer transport system component